MLHSGNQYKALIASPCGIITSRMSNTCAKERKCPDTCDDASLTEKRGRQVPVSHGKI